jgi:transcriptional regulator HMO1
MSEEQTLESLAKDVASIKKMLTDMKKGDSTRRRKDPNAPSRPLNAYFVFQKDARPKVKAELEKKLKNGEKAPNSAVNDELKRQWEDIKTNKPELYKKFVATANAEKKRYEKEKATYQAKKTAESPEDEKSAEDVSEEEPKTPPPKKVTKAVKAEKTEEKPAAKKTVKPAAKTEEKPAAKKAVKTTKVEEKPVTKKASTAKSSKKAPEPEPEEISGEDSNLSEIASLDSNAFSDDDLLEDL